MIKWLMKEKIKKTRHTFFVFLRVNSCAFVAKKER